MDNIEHLCEMTVKAYRLLMAGVFGDSMHECEPVCLDAAEKIAVSVWVEENEHPQPVKQVEPMRPLEPWTKDEEIRLNKIALRINDGTLKAFWPIIDYLKAQRMFTEEHHTIQSILPHLNVEQKRDLLRLEGV